MFFEEKCFLMCSVYDCYLAVHTVLEVWIERLSKQRSYLSWENSGTVTCLSTHFFSQCSNETMHTQPQDLHTSSDYIIFVWLCLPMCVWVCVWFTLITLYVAFRWYQLNKLHRPRLDISQPKIVLLHSKYIEHIHFASTSVRCFVVLLCAAFVWYF